MAANHLKAIRKREGFTITELARAASVSTRTVERAEQGEPSVREESRAKIVKGLNRLVGEEGRHSLSDVFPGLGQPGGRGGKG